MENAEKFLELKTRSGRSISHVSADTDKVTAWELNAISWFKNTLKCLVKDVLTGDYG